MQRRIIFAPRSTLEAFAHYVNKLYTGIYLINANLYGIKTVFPKKHLQILFLSIVSSLFFSTKLISMNSINKKKEIPACALNRAYNRQTEIINTMLGSFRVVRTSRKQNTSSEYHLYKNNRKIISLKRSFLELEYAIHEISTMLTEGTEERIKEVSETQEKLGKQLESLIKTKNPRKLLNKMILIKEKYQAKKRNITAKINYCFHAYNGRYAPKLVIYNENSCSLCTQATNSDNGGYRISQATRRKLIITGAATCAIVGILLATKILKNKVFHNNFFHNN